MRGELDTEQNCNILTSTLMAITAFLSRSPGLLNWGPILSGIRSSFQHLLSNSSEALKFNCSIGGPKDPLCWVLVPSTGSYLQLPDFFSSPGLYNFSTLTFFLWASQICLFFTQVHFLFWQLDWVGGQYTTNERTKHFFIKIYLSFYLYKGAIVCC